MTDVAAAAIMCASKAVFSWDLVFKKFMNVIFIEKRDEENILDWQTVSETAQPEY
jgi:translation initiation factor 3 subunit D